MKWLTVWPVFEIMGYALQKLTKSFAQMKQNKWPYHTLGEIAVEQIGKPLFNLKSN
jgi:hypothetical protein